MAEQPEITMAKFVKVTFVRFWYFGKFGKQRRKTRELPKIPKIPVQIKRECAKTALLLITAIDFVVAAVRTSCFASC